MTIHAAIFWQERLCSALLGRYPEISAFNLVRFLVLNTFDY